jgi:hypothetical protein
MCASATPGRWHGRTVFPPRGRNPSGCRRLHFLRRPGGSRTRWLRSSNGLAAWGDHVWGRICALPSPSAKADGPVLQSANARSRALCNTGSPGQAGRRRRSLDGLSPSRNPSSTQILIDAYREIDANDPAATFKAFRVRNQSLTIAVTSISTRAEAGVRAATCTRVLAGRDSPNVSRCARATWWASVISRM